VSLENNVTWIKGDHVLQFGGRVRVDHVNRRESQQIQGSHDFSGSWTALWDPEREKAVSRTGTGLASLLMGLGTFYSVNFQTRGPGPLYWRQNEFGLYINDKWRVHPKVTLNLGLRWDAWTPLREKYDRMFVTDLDTFADKFEVITPHRTAAEEMPGIPGGVLSSWKARGLSWVTADSIGFPGALSNPDWNNFGPRIGLSYMLSPKTVIRGSYGEYFWKGRAFSHHATPMQSAGLQAPGGLRFRNEPDYKPGNLDPTGDDGIYTYTNAPEPGDCVDQIDIDTEATYSIPPYAVYVNIPDSRNWRTEHARSWHLTLEQEILRETSLRFSFTGIMGRDLFHLNDLSQLETEFNYVTRTKERYPLGRYARDQLRLNPDWKVRLRNNQGYASTHTFQTEIKRRFSDGVGFQAFYIYTRALETDGNTPSFDNLYHYPNPVGSHFAGPPSYEELLDFVYWNSADIPPHRVVFNGIVDLPFGRGKRFGSDVSGTLNQIIGGWQVAFLGYWRSGFYQTIDTNFGVFRDYIITPGDRPVVEIFGDTQKLWFAGDFNPARCTGGDCAGLTGYVPENRSQRAIHMYGPNFDNRIPIELANGDTYMAYVLPNPWTGENPRQFWPFSRNNFMGPQAWNLDLSLAKSFFFTEDVQLRFKADFFNFFNHPNDPNPDVSTGLVNLGTQTNEPRTIQLSLKFDW